MTSLAIIYSTVYSGTDDRKHQSSASLAFVRGIHRWSVNSPHKGPVTRKMFPFDDVIMPYYITYIYGCPVHAQAILNNYKINLNYRQTSNICRTLVRNKIVDHSDVFGASPDDAAPTTSSFSTWHLASMDWVKAAARREERHLRFGIWCGSY